MKIFNFNFFFKKRDFHNLRNLTPIKKIKKSKTSNKETLIEFIEKKKIINIEHSKLEKDDETINTNETNDITPKSTIKVKKLLMSNSARNYNLLDNNNSNNKDTDGRIRKRNFLIKDYSANDIFSGKIFRIDKNANNEIRKSTSKKDVFKNNIFGNTNNELITNKNKYLFKNLGKIKQNNKNNVKYLKTEENNNNEKILNKIIKQFREKRKNKYNENTIKNLENVIILENKRYKKCLEKEKEKRKIKQRVLKRHELFNNTLTKINDSTLTFGTKQLIINERIGADESIKLGIYSSWAREENGLEIECFKIGSNHLCFCGHFFKSHKKYIVTSFDTSCNICNCKGFEYIPQYPEETNEWKIALKKNFDYNDWKPLCKCYHSFIEHDSKNNFKCNVEKCLCKCFSSKFLCAICNRPWENHYMFYTTEAERNRMNLPIGYEYKPFTRDMYRQLFN